MITISIDVKKIDKSLLYPGKKGTYLNVTLKDNKEGRDQYGNDGFVTQDVTAEARQRGEKGPIIGNWKEIGGKKPTGEAKRNPPAKRSYDETQDPPF